MTWEMYSMGVQWPKDATEVMFSFPSYFRVKTFLNELPGKGLAYMNAIECEGRSQSTGGKPMDLWYFSMAHTTLLVDEFMKKHNLIGKTTREIDRYLDKNELSMPEAPKIYLPDMTIGQKLVIRGKTNVDFTFVVVGHSHVTV